MDKMIFFTQEHGVLLIKLLLAHIISDFVLQTKSMVEQKSWLSKDMLLHISIVFISTALFSGLWIEAVFITITHYLIDAVKIQILKSKPNWLFKLFLADQFLHVAILLVFWTLHFELFSKWKIIASTSLNNYHLNLLLLAYFVAVFPINHIVKFTLQGIAKKGDSSEEKTGKQYQNEHGGELIGIFERIIILTLVLLGQYEAIGFLITGKSIIRFAGHEEHIKSEYVIVGTMMSYAITIILGVVTNWLLHL